MIVLVLVFVVRPVATAVALARGHLPWRQKAMIGWVDPRGIVAAATAAQFATVMATAGYDSDLMLPVIFGVVFGTGLIYGLSAPLVGRWLKVVEPPATGVAFLGLDDWSLELGRQFARHEVPVAFISDRELAGEDLEFPHATLQAAGSAVEETVLENQLAWVVVSEQPTGAVQMMTALCVEHFGRSHVLMVSLGEHDGGRMTSGTVGVREYAPGYTAYDLEEIFTGGARIVELNSMQEPCSIPLAVIHDDGSVDLVPKARKVTKGSVILGMLWDESQDVRPPGRRGRLTR